jgi:hypothetical protein
MRAMTQADATTPKERTPKAVAWLAAYVYGTIATLVAIGSLTFEKHPNPVSSTGVIVVGATAIWLAHAVSNMVARRARDGANLHASDIMSELRSSWPIVSAAIPGAVVMAIACFGLWTASTGLVIDEVIGVVALAAVGVATAGGSQRSLARRLVYVAALTAVGLAIVGLEVAAHLL